MLEIIGNVVIGSILAFTMLMVVRIIVVSRYTHDLINNHLEELTEYPDQDAMLFNFKKWNFNKA